MLKLESAIAAAVAALLPFQCSMKDYPEYDSIAALEAAIMAGDASLFERGFNNCDIEELRGALAQDVVMVHDQAGRTKGRGVFLKPVKANICSGAPQKPLRYLDPDTTQIYPLFENGRLYGALQFGRHSFYIQEENADPYLTNRARFMTEWELATEGWQVKTAYSYDHMNPNENSPLDTDVLEGGFDQQATIEFMLKAHNVRAQSVAIIRSGQLVEVRNFGFYREGQATSIDTLYNVASLAKPVTALTILKLIDNDLLRLDETLADHYLDPELADDPRAKQVTIRHVLSHASGLPNWRYLTDSGKLHLQFEPGTDYQYSGEGYEWMRLAVEKKLGRSLEELADEFVFQPAGMVSTSYLYPDKDKEPLLAYRYDSAGTKLDIPPHHEANAAANLITTAEDYGRFLAFVAAGAGLQDALATQMMSTQVVQSETLDFGLGWQIVRSEMMAIQHSGSDAGVRSLAILWPASGDGIVILSNSDGALQTWQRIITEQFGERGWDLLRANG